MHREQHSVGSKHFPFPTMPAPHGVGTYGIEDEGVVDEVVTEEVLDWERETQGPPIHPVPQ